jgi:predicted acylesterase/phospholipase RssA
LIIASASPPGFFPPHEVDGQLWMDGGTVYNLELPSLVE